MRRMALLLALTGFSACQDYRFNPVGKCLIQPGQTTVPVAGVSTADILFVVDDSFSMHPIQQSLADNFGSFVQQLATTQQQRVSSGKEALDFYIAVTTSSVLVNRYDNFNGACGRVTPNVCSIDNPPFNVSRPPYTYACSGNGACGDIWTDYYNYHSSTACTPGILVQNGAPYPAGGFVALGTTNPRVLAFTKNLDWANWSTDSTITGLRNQFAQNILVGDCGANQEMHLEAGKLAVQKALAGQQGLPAGVTWPHPGSKLVVVFVANEDDCSTRRADQGGLVWSGASGADTCAQAADDPASSALYPVVEYADYFATRGHPFGAAFIRPGDAGCDCVGNPQPPATCGGYGKATRFKALANELRNRGASVYEDSVCSQDFAATLRNIVILATPVDSLKLPTAPAAGVVTQLRVRGSDGKTVHTCVGPDQNQEWWFVECNTDPPQVISGVSQCIRLKPDSACQPAQGQSLYAAYLGRVPEAGCTTATDCAVALTNDAANASSFVCDGANAATSTKGTCLCAP